MAGVIATIPKFQFSANGVPMVGGTLDTYIAGSTTPATTWQDAAITIANTNPISLDARGECVLWLDPAVVYKFVLKNAQGVIQWTQDNISNPAALANSLRADLAAATGASLVGYLHAGTGAAATDVQEKLRRLAVDLADFTGADPTGATASDAALQNALSTGKAINLGGPENTWRFDTLSSYIGKVILFGTGAKVKTDVLFLKVTDGTGSRLFGFNVYPVTTPYTIKRNTSTWVNVAGDVIASLEGYIPSIQDADIWAGIPAGYKTANAGINPAIHFNVSSAAGASDVEITGLRGRQLSIIIEGYTHSSVHHNDFGAGALTYGGIVFVNGVNRAYNSAFLGFTLPRGVGNCADNNNIQYATLCGIVWFGNDGFSMCNNTATYCGESGLKTYQYDGVAGLSETKACISTAGKIIGNTTSDNYFDGLDAQIVYGGIFEYAYAGTTLSANVAQRNRYTGITCNGANFAVTGNHANSNGTHGISVTGWAHTVVGNNARNNCTTGTALVAQPFDILVQGDDCVSYANCIWNSAAPATWNYLHSGLLGAEPTSGHEGLDFGNYCDQGAGRIYVGKTIPSSKVGIIGVPSVQTSGYFQASAVKNVTTAAYSVGSTDSALSFYTTVACTVTLPSAVSFPGRILKMRNTNTFAINSASSNVGQIIGGAPSAALLPATVGKWIELQSNGAEWIIMAAN